MRNGDAEWSRLRLGDIATSIRNGLFAARPTDDPVGTRILRISAVRGGRVNLDEPRYVQGVNDEQIRKFALCPGDLLLTRYNGSRRLVGTSGIVPEHDEVTLYPDKLIRVVLEPTCADSRFVNYQLQAPHVRQHLEPRIRTTAGQSGISGPDVRDIPLVLPHLAEQRRVVDLLEDHLSIIDAVLDSCALATRRLNSLHKGILINLIPDESRYPVTWKHSTVSRAGTVELGRQRHPDWHSGTNMKPYLRVANVFEDRIDTSDVKTMHWPEGTFERFKLHNGDVLLNEGQSPEFLGRPAIYRGEPPEIAFTNSLLRFRVGRDVTPEFALLVFRRHMHAGRFQREARITTNIAHLSASRLKPIEFPIPPIDEQEEIVRVASERLSRIESIRRSVNSVEARTTALRRSVLASAFSGQLTDGATDDRIEVLAGV